jgi:hypothetical protein
LEGVRVHGLRKREHERISRKECTALGKREPYFGRGVELLAT